MPSLSPEFLIIQNKYEKSKFLLKQEMNYAFPILQNLCYPNKTYWKSRVKTLDKTMYSSNKLLLSLLFRFIFLQIDGCFAFLKIFFMMLM